MGGYLTVRTLENLLGVRDVMDDGCTLTPDRD